MFLAAMLCYVVIQMLITWLIAMKTNNPSLVDLAWAVGLTVIGVSGQIVFYQSWLNGLLLAVILAWGLRLSGYLWFTRLAKGLVDKRYIALSDQWHSHKHLKLLANYLLQGFLQLVIAIPLFFMTKINQIDFWLILGISISVLAIVCEHFADMQLHHYRQQGTGGVCDVGLWRYSRHPNYFFEWLVWLGFCLVCLGLPYGYLSFISAISLLLIMTMVTGPMTEALSLKSRGDAYAQYQAKVSMFLPWFRKN